MMLIGKKKKKYIYRLIASAKVQKKWQIYKKSNKFFGQFKKKQYFRTRFCEKA